MHYSPPPDQQDYYEQVWETARLIPHGMVATYGQIARLIPAPIGVAPEAYAAFGPRWVGDAMAACPGDVPWQRVINAQGKISQRGPSAEKQRLLLDAEGIPFVNEKVDLKVYQWRGPGSEDEPRQASLF